MLSFLIDAQARRQTVVGYGAPAKGNTLLNYCGIGPDMIDYTVRPEPPQAGPVPAGQPHPDPRARPDRARQARLVLILPWNLKDEIIGQLAYIREWGGQFAARTPDLRLHP